MKFRNFLSTVHFYVTESKFFSTKIKVADLLNILMQCWWGMKGRFFLFVVCYCLVSNYLVSLSLLFLAKKVISILFIASDKGVERLTQNVPEKTDLLLLTKHASEKDTSRHNYLSQSLTFLIQISAARTYGKKWISQGWKKWYWDGES